MGSLNDKKAIERADRKEKDIRKQELNDIRTVLASSSGRRLLWRLMGRCKTFGSMFSADAISMAYNSGQQDLGHFIMSEIVAADENLLLKMMRENKQENANVH